MEPIRISTQLAEAELYSYGAHLTRWTPRGEKPVLYLSPAAIFTPGKGIRGGVPIIFPWFGPRSDGKPGPVHGFARTREWMSEGQRATEDGNVEIAFVLQAGVRFRAMIGTELSVALEITNLSTEPFTFEEA